MIQGSLCRLERCLMTLTLPTLSSPNSRIARRLHCKHNRSQNARCKSNLSAFATTQRYRCASNIIQSPVKHIEIPNLLIPDMVWEAVDKFPDATAMKCGVTGTSYTYAQIQRMSLRFANSLRKAGFKHRDVIALVLPNCPSFPIMVLGALEAGLAVSFVNHAYTPDEICHQLKDSGSVCVVAGEAQLRNVQAAIKKVENTTQSKPIKRVILLDIPQLQSIPTGVTRFSEMIADGVDESRKSTNSVQVNDVALLPYSSGTTGLSKGVCLSHRNIVANVLQISANEASVIRSAGNDQDNLLGLLPFYHIYGLVVILLNGLRNGAQITTLPKFDQDQFVKTLENNKVSVMMMVPPLILFLGSSSKVTRKHLSHVRVVFSGAAPLGASDMEKVYAKLPTDNNCIISQAYGMTETSPVTTLPLIPVKNLATVGAPVANTSAKIISVTTGEALGPRQSGELCFKGPQVMLGYHNNPKATADMIDADGWLKTGDIGYYEEDGHMYVQDRLKELIKVKGFQVPPAELEEVLRTHTSVSDVGVIGVPDARAGEVPVAYIVREKDKTLTEDNVKEFLAEKVSKHKQVSKVIFVDTIPKSAAGKILRKELREIYKSSHK